MITKLMIPGPAGNLEAEIEVPSISSDKKLLAIICHPHPLHQGTMNNKVVTTLARVFERFGAITIRFNFRGVGNSEGQHGYSVGELDDLRAVIAWANRQYPDHLLLLAGFSFGAYIATKVATEVHPLALITVAPAVHHAPYEELPVITFPWIVVQGEADEVVPVEQVNAWLATLKPQPIIIRFPDVSHFFHGQLLTLRDTLIETLKGIL